MPPELWPPTLRPRHALEVHGMMVPIEQPLRAAKHGRPNGQLPGGRAAPVSQVVALPPVTAQQHQAGAQGGRAEGAGRLRLQHGAAQVAAAQLRAATILNDGRAVAGEGHEPHVVLGGGRLPSGCEAPQRRPREARHAAGGAPGAYDGRHHPQLRHTRRLHELPEGPPQGRPLKESHGSPVQQRREKQPRPHHPPQVGGPRQHAPRAQVHVCPCIHPTPQRCRVRPRDRLGLPCGSRGEQHAARVSRGRHMGASLALAPLPSP
mmetsp:Transcript_9824/g.29563  ORF Transcript_9824/g.29563 Transcript_9824/m.29563 type:complete len:263 (+) Transcript_9824:210-998(+)